jgi:hypothetical protein
VDGRDRAETASWHRSGVAPDVVRSAGLLIAAPRDGVRSSTDELSRAAVHGAVRRLRRGAYVGADHWDGLNDDARYGLVVRAVAAAQPDPLLSHWSAASVLGLPLVGRHGDAVHLIQAPKGGGRSRRDVRRHQAAGAVPETLVDGIRATTAARTIVDLACDGGLLPAVVAGDAALRSGVVTRAQLDAEVVAAGRRHGVRTARRAVAIVNPLAESAGESLSRVRMAELGLTMPVLQRALRDADGFVARVDFLWEGLRVVGEFDGRGKYGSEDPRATADRVWNEKRREDRIRALGYAVVRWTWDDAWRGDPMARLLRAAGVR